MASHRRAPSCAVPLYVRGLCAVTPAWTAYAPPRGAAAACSGSSSAAECSRCCSAEGQTTQKNDDRGKKTATKLQINSVQKYQEYTNNKQKINDLTVSIKRGPKQTKYL